MNLALNIVLYVNGRSLQCEQVTWSVPDELVMQLLPASPAEPGPSIWASVEQAEPVVMVRDERPLVERSWLHSAQYQRYGKRVVEAVAKMGRFRGTAAELCKRTGLDVDSRVVGPALHSALGAGELVGEVSPKRSSVPCVYDVWVPVAEQQTALLPAGRVTDDMEAALWVALQRGVELDGTDTAVFQSVLGRAPEGDELCEMRRLLGRLSEERRIDFLEILRDGAPSLWEVQA